MCQSMSLTAIPCLELKYGIRNKDADSREGGHLCRHPVSTDINGATWDSKCQEKKRRREKAERRKEEDVRIGYKIDKSFEMWEIFYNPRRFE